MKHQEGTARVRAMWFRILSTSFQMRGFRAEKSSSIAFGVQTGAGAGALAGAALASIREVIWSCSSSSKTSS
jgi:hypothetical protein